MAAATGNRTSSALSNLTFRVPCPGWRPDHAASNVNMTQGHRGIGLMELRSGYERLGSVSLLSVVLLFLSGCGMHGFHARNIPVRHASFGPRCPSCSLTKDTGCQCSPDGWSCGQTVWRPLISQHSEWIETTRSNPTEAGDIGLPAEEPEPTPVEGIPPLRQTSFLHPSTRTLPGKWNFPRLNPKASRPLVSPPEMAFPTPERLDIIDKLGV